ncbi:MAG TPA: sulfatase [Bryobacteraceae bacterium]|nr:sulfatase [Bryobacteraceae bacterium]
MSVLSRRSFVGAAAGSVAAGFLEGKSRPRNVLFIASDDLNECLSCYGHPVVRTPNIDRIAKAGVRFDRAYTQFPLCSPSRTSLMTGYAPDKTKVYELQTHFRTVLPDAVTLGQAFQKNGYFTGRVGKIYHYGVPSTIGTSGLDDAPTWNLAANPNGVDHTREEPLVTNYTPQNRGLGAAVAFYASPAKDEEHTDGITADTIAGLLEGHKKDPFFLAAGFYRPHVPWIAPSKYFDMFPLDKIDLIPFDESELKIAPPLAYTIRPANYGMNEKQRKESMRAYYASIAFLDAQVGKVLDAVDRLKLGDDTTVVFWSDHGYQLGEHGQWMKQTLFEPSARVPLLIGGAGVKARGRACSRTVELLDLYPTLVDLCGLKEAPSDLHGQSLSRLLEKTDAAWDKPAITQVRRAKAAGYSIRTERHRYSMWGDGAEGEELYDYELDPKEMKNLAQDAGSQGLKMQLRARLQEILARRGKAG